MFKKVLFLATAVTFIGANSFAENVKLVTNKHKNRKVPVTQVNEEEWSGNVYDLSFVAYDQSFADEFGLKPELVTNMDKGLRFLEVKMITEGRETNCYYNMVLDKSVEVAFPKENSVLDNYPTINFNETTITSIGQKDLIEKNKHLIKLKNIPRKAENIGKYSNRLYVGTKNYQKDKPRAKNGTFLMYYVQDRLNYKIISMKGYCSLDANVFEIPKPGVWVAKDELSYDTMAQVSPDHFNRFLIPELITNQFAPIILDFQKSVRDDRRTKEQERQKQEAPKKKKSFFNF